MVRLTSRRRIVLAIVALSSAVITGTFIAGRQAVYEGKAIVFVSQVFPTGRSGLELDPFVATFQASLTLPESLNATSQAIGISVDKLRAGLSSARSSQGTIVTVSFKPAEQRTMAMLVSRGASLVTLRTLAKQEVAQAAAKAQQGKEALKLASGEQSNFEERVGYVNLGAEYDAQRQRLASLITDASTSSADVAAAKTRLAELASLQLERDELLSRVSRAQGSLADSEEARGEAETRLATVDAPGVVVGGTAVPVSRLPAITRGVIGAALVAVVEGIGLFALIDRRERRSCRSASSAALPSPAL